MSNRYRPEEVEAETKFKKAQIVAYYQTQVQRNLVCSPFSLIYLGSTLLGVPSGTRRKVPTAARTPQRLLLLPLDGVVTPEDPFDRPTGLCEFPHFVYLVTLYPILMGTSSALSRLLLKRVH